MPRFAANISFLFNDIPFERRFSAAADAGFQAVEFLFPYAIGAERLRQLALDAGVGISLFNAPPGDWDGGERGIAAIPGREGEFSEGAELALEYARTLGCPRVHVLAGTTGPDDAPEPALETYAENLRAASSLFSVHGIEVMIEPINPIDMPGYLLNLPEQAEEIIKDNALENVFIQYDLYHGAMQGIDLMGSVWRHMPLIRHFQVAGMPGRAEPDSGNVDYVPVFNLIDELGYDGWIGCEYRPRGDTVAGLGWLDVKQARSG